MSATDKAWANLIDCFFLKCRGESWLELKDAINAYTDLAVAEAEHAENERGAALLRQCVGEVGDFRFALRSALAPFWPSNPGVASEEIVDAVKRLAEARAPLVEVLEKVLFEYEWKYRHILIDFPNSKPFEERPEVVAARAALAAKETP